MFGGAPMIGRDVNAQRRSLSVYVWRRAQIGRDVNVQHRTLHGQNFIRTRVQTVLPPGLRRLTQQMHPAGNKEVRRNG